MRASRMVAAIGLGLAGAGSAAAADLPMGKAEPIEYVRICSEFGEGFFYSPGTDTCLKIGGYLRAEWRYGSPGNRSANVWTGFTRAYTTFDARTQTEYGALRSYIATRWEYNNGNQFGLERGFIEFAGITAGHQFSMFDSYVGPMFGNQRFFDDPISGTTTTYVDMFAYTAKLGDGLSATLSAEDGRDRRGINNSAAVIPNLDPGGLANYGGQSVPDIVGNVKHSGAWGSAQISGAVHQLRSLDPDVDAGYGFAAEAGVEWKLDTLVSKGSKIQAIANWTDGAPQYANVAGRTSTKGVNVDVADATILDGDFEKTRTYGFGAAFVYYWVPGRWRTSGEATYIDVDQASALTTIGNYRDFKEYTVGLNTVFTPAKGLDIGAEITYRDIDYDGTIRSAGQSFGRNDTWLGRPRIQRNF